MSRPPSRKAVENHLKDISRDLAWLYPNHQAAPYAWALSGADGLKSSMSAVHVGGQPSNPTANKVFQRRVNRVCQAAKAIEQAKQCLALARSALEQNQSGEVEVPTEPWWLTVKEHEDLLAKQQFRQANGGGFGES